MGSASMKPYFACLGSYIEDFLNDLAKYGSILLPEVFGMSLFHHLFLFFISLSSG